MESLASSVRDFPVQAVSVQQLDGQKGYRTTRALPAQGRRSGEIPLKIIRGEHISLYRDKLETT